MLLLWLLRNWYINNANSKDSHIFFPTDLRGIHDEMWTHPVKEINVTLLPPFLHLSHYSHNSKCGLSSSQNQSKALEQMTKAGQSFIMTAGSSALTNLVTCLHYPSHTIPQSSSNFFCSNFNQVGICIFAGMDSIMLAWPTVAEEQDEVLGLMVPRAEFQCSI